MKKLLSIFISAIIILNLFGCSIKFSNTDFENLTYTAFGDSITYGADYFNNYSQMETPYVEEVGNILKLASTNNQGVSGATLSSNNLGLHCMTSSITSFNENSDIISVLGGVNDYNRDLPLGTISDEDISTIYGSLHASMSYLTDNYPNSFIFYMTPYKENYSGRHYSDINSKGYTLEDVANAIKEVAEIYSIPVLDLFNEGNFESVMNNSDCDGIHPNQDFILSDTAPQIANFIKNNYK